MWLTHLLPFFTALARAAINWDVYEYGVVPTFHWSNPIPSDGTDPGGFDVHCRATRTFHARLYKLKDLSESPPLGLAPWRRGIEDFLSRAEYPGSWDGVDHKGLDREIVVMEWADVPTSVKQWLEEQQRDNVERRRWLFGVFEKPRRDGESVRVTATPRVTAASEASASSAVEGEAEQRGGDTEEMEKVSDEDKIMVFPAGAIYDILPLWVARGSGCDREWFQSPNDHVTHILTLPGDLHNLAKYKPQAIDHAVLAWPVEHTKPNRDRGERGMTFTVQAMSVTESEEGKHSRLMWEKLHRVIRRNERRQQREERQKARREMEEGRVRDEL